MKKTVTEKNIASQTTLNLAVRERSVMSRPYVFLPILLVILIVAFVVGKFAVADRYAKVIDARREVEQMEAELRRIQDAYADYDEVQSEYNRYTYKGFDRTLADRLKIMSLIEREIMSVCDVQRFSISNRQLALSVEGLTLESTSALISRLNADELVDSVTVSTYDATTSTGKVQAVTDMVIVLSDASVEKEVAK